MPWRPLTGIVLLLASLPIGYWGLVVNAWDDEGTGGMQALILAAALAILGIGLLILWVRERRET